MLLWDGDGAELGTTVPRSPTLWRIQRATLTGQRDYACPLFQVSLCLAAFLSLEGLVSSLIPSGLASSRTIRLGLLSLRPRSTQFIQAIIAMRQAVQYQEHQLRRRRHVSARVVRPLVSQNLPFRG